MEIRYSPTLAGAPWSTPPPYLGQLSARHDRLHAQSFLPTVIMQNILKRMHLDLAAIKKNEPSQRSGNRRPGQTGRRLETVRENPVFDNAELWPMKGGVQALTKCSLPTAARVGFPAGASSSEPHKTALIVHGLQLAGQNGAASCAACSKEAVSWLKALPTRQIAHLRSATQVKTVLDADKAVRRQPHMVVYRCWSMPT